MDPSDREAMRLHDRATRGEALTPEERVRLDGWYTRQDAAEEEQIGGMGSPVSQDVTHRLERIRQATERIRTLEAGNDHLRREIALLLERLAARAA